MNTNAMNPANFKKFRCLMPEQPGGDKKGLFASSGAVFRGRSSNPGKRSTGSVLWISNPEPQALADELLRGDSGCDAEVYLDAKDQDALAEELTKTPPITKGFFLYQVYWGDSRGVSIASIIESVRHLQLRPANVRETMLFALTDDGYSRDMGCFGLLSDGRLLGIQQDRDDLWLQPTMISPEAKLYEAGGLILVPNA